jgi:alpha-beta hydrolase superfamily lysophospholipase
MEAAGGRGAWRMRTVWCVTEPQRGWTPDVLPGFEQTVLPMPPSWDGPVETVLVRRTTQLTSGGAVLYVHGFGDYFFQSHLADYYETQGLRFYAVDLRRHGRAILEHQHPNTCRSIDEYLEDIDAAIEVLVGEEGVTWLLVNGHSTGGLAAAIQAHRGEQKRAVDALYLNSPFLDMNLPAWQEALVEPFLAAIGGVLPGLSLPSLDPLYGESIHDSSRGAWAFDLDWKPLAGFPATAGWIRAIHRAQAEIEDGLSIQAPVLVLHAAGSLHPKSWSEDIRRADVVLDVDDIARLAPMLGARVEVEAVPEGIHDLALAEDGPREEAFRMLTDWLTRVRQV